MCVHTFLCLLLDGLIAAHTLVLTYSLTESTPVLALKLYIPASNISGNMYNKSHNTIDYLTQKEDYILQHPFQFFTSTLQVMVGSGLASLTITVATAASSSPFFLYCFVLQNKCACCLQ